MMKCFNLFLENTLPRSFGQPCTNHSLDGGSGFVLWTVRWRKWFLLHEQRVKVGDSKRLLPLSVSIGPESAREGKIIPAILRNSRRLRRGDSTCPLSHP